MIINCCHLFSFVTALMLGCRTKYQIWRRSHQYMRVQSDDGQPLEAKDDTYVIVTALAKLAVIMGYFYLCDRLVISSAGGQKSHMKIS